MKEAVFESQYKKLNSEQKKAVDSVEGPMIVIAGPGTGKTSILTLRIANILRKTDTMPENILALTFTESGVHSMRKKLLEIVGASAYRIPIHTFHSFCNEIIKNFPQEFPRIIGAQHVTDLDQINILESVLENTKLVALKPSGNPVYYLKAILGFIKELKREDVDSKEYLKIVTDFESDLLSSDDLKHEKGAHKGEVKAKYKPLLRKIENSRELALVYSKYEEALEESRLYDFEDMIVEVLRALRNNNELLLELQENYQYVLADEHQDANRGQNRLLEFLSGFHKNPNLFVVGDEKQAIFRFQGASLENFLYFKRRFPEAEVVSLVKNYRSTQGILDASHELISKNASGTIERVKLEAREKAKLANIFIANLDTPQQEATFVADDIQKRIARGEKAEQIAVLFRNNKDAGDISRALDAAGVPYVLHTDFDIFSDEYIQKLFFVLRAVNDFGNEELLAKAIFMDFFKLNHLDIYKVFVYSKSVRKNIFEVIKSKRELESAGIDDTQPFIDFFANFHELSVIAKNKSLVEAFQEISVRIGYVGIILSKPRSLELIASYDSLLAHMIELLERHKYARLSDYIQLVDKMNIHGVSIKARSVSTHPGKVNLLTAHKSKGLEFDFVYCLNLNDGHWGGRRSPSHFLPIGVTLVNGEEDQVADERRLLYVVLTRARKEITLTYANYRTSGKELVPSQFLEEIDQSLVTRINARVELGASTRGKKETHSNDLDIKNRDYLTNLFLEQGLSVSALNNYLTCPWRFFFNNLIRVPQTQERHQLYGTAIHETLKVFFDAYKDEKKITKKEFLGFFEGFLNRKALSESDFKLFLERGISALGGYFDTYVGTWPKNIFNEFNIADVVMPIEFGGETKEIVLRGQLDKVELLEGSNVNVVDYKTGKPKSRRDIEGETESSEGNIKRQLVFYKILLTGTKKADFIMQTGEIDFIEPNDRGIYKKEKFEVTDAEISDVTQLIKKSAQEILGLTFWNTECEDPECEFCEMRKLMIAEPNPTEKGQKSNHS